MKMRFWRVWLDDERKCPYTDFESFHSVNEVIEFVKTHVGAIMFDLDHDLGIYAQDGGDAIKLIYWLLENGYHENKDYAFTFRFHTMNPVGRANMEALVQRYF